jgi:hypothetical protein
MVVGRIGAKALRILAGRTKQAEMQTEGSDDRGRHTCLTDSKDGCRQTYTIGRLAIGRAACLACRDNDSRQN